MSISSLMKASALLLCLAAPAVAADLDMKGVDAIFGRTPAQSDGVYRYGFPRSDLHVTVDGVVIKPAFALGGWVGFKQMNGKAMIMGDLALTETEVAPVMAKLLENGVEVTALHNHLLRATPPTFYMHIGGHGDPEKIASVIRSALELTKTPLTTPPAAAAPRQHRDRYSKNRRGSRSKRPRERWSVSIRDRASRQDHERRHGYTLRARIGDCHQFSAHWRRQGCDHRRFHECWLRRLYPSSPRYARRASK